MAARAALIAVPGTRAAYQASPDLVLTFAGLRWTIGVFIETPVASAADILVSFDGVNDHAALTCSATTTAAPAVVLKQPATRVWLRQTRPGGDDSIVAVTVEDTPGSD